MEEALRILGYDQRWLSYEFITDAAFRAQLVGLRAARKANQS